MTEFDCCVYLLVLKYKTVLPYLTEFIYLLNYLDRFRSEAFLVRLAVQYRQIVGNE